MGFIEFALALWRCTQCQKTYLSQTKAERCCASRKW